MRLVEALAGDRARARRRAAHGRRRRAHRCVSGGRATGVALAGGETVAATRAVIASVTPTQLYGRAAARERDARPTSGEAAAGLPLRPRRHADPPRARRAAAVGLARGRAARAHARWCTSRPASTASRARSTRPSAACCRPRRRSSPASPARSTPAARPTASRIIWIQLQELPRRPDAATRSARSTSATAPGRETLREAYADRIVARLGDADHEPRAARRSSASCSRPPTSRRLNCNLVGGDIYAGSCALDQNLLWRPSGRLPGHATTRRRPLADRRLARTRGPGLGAGLGLPRRQAAARAAAAAARARARHRRRGKLRERLPL